MGKAGSTVGLEGVVKHADGKAEVAKKTWGRGGEAEERVGAELDRLRPHGFEVLHDLGHRRVGNFDHVVVGPTGVFPVETKSHRRRVSVAPDGRGLLLGGCPSEKDFVRQALHEAEVLLEILGARPEQIRPLFCFPNGKPAKGLVASGVAVLGLGGLVGESAGGEVVLREGDVREFSKRLSRLAR